MSKRQIRLTPASEIEMEAYNGNWGPWKLDTRNLVLYMMYENTDTRRYEVDLEQCLTSAGTLDWIMQIANKTWADKDDSVIAGLVRAIDDVIRPQAFLCSFGGSRRISRAKVRELVRQAQR